MSDAELESFKTDIDLRAYAASKGFERDKDKSWSGSDVMRHASGEKVIISRGPDGHYVYYSVHGDDRDNGTIIDFIQNRGRGLTLGEVRKELRPWLGNPPATTPTFTPLATTTKDRMRVAAAYARMVETDHHPYLEGERRIPAALLQSKRFAGTFRIDARGNAAFPHFDQEGLAGFELKNARFTGFSAGGSKALWSSRTIADDNTLVVCESTIDAMSHAVLFPNARARYASLGGKPNPQQPELVRAAAARLDHGSEVVAAMDADEAGRELTEVVRRAVELSGRSDLRFRVHEPQGFKDFNDQLRGVSVVPARYVEPQPL
jgi:hypothetical protein